MKNLKRVIKCTFICLFSSSDCNLLYQFYRLLLAFKRKLLPPSSGMEEVGSLETLVTIHENLKSYVSCLSVGIKSLLIGLCKSSVSHKQIWDSYKPINAKFYLYFEFGSV